VNGEAVARVLVEAGADVNSKDQVSVKWGDEGQMIGKTFYSVDVNAKETVSEMGLERGQEGGDRRDFGEN
jgi:hypothetical protein